MFVEDPHPLRLRLVREHFPHGCLIEEYDVSVIGMILTYLVVYRVVHEFEELFHHHGHGGDTETGGLGDVVLEPT